MSASSGAPPPQIFLPPPSPIPSPNTDVIRRRLLRYGVNPTPKILHALRKKEAQKAARKSRKQALQSQAPALSEAQRQLAEEEDRFRTMRREYNEVRKAVEVGKGRPWERAGVVDLGTEEWDGGRLKGEHLAELREMLSERNGERLHWLLEDDVEREVEGGDPALAVDMKNRRTGWTQRNGSDQDKIRWLVHRLSITNLSIQDWKFPKLMRQSGLLFAENCLIKILEQLGALGNWQQAMFVVDWVYSQREYRHSQSRFVYTKLLSVIGKARKPSEALHVFNIMREDCQIYPDMAAYHSIAVTLGQSGLVKELVHTIESMKQKPFKKLKNMRNKNWDPCLEPDVVIYNAVLNACVPTHQWKGVSWVLQEMRSTGLNPNGATYGLAMEVMLEAGKYDIVHKLFQSMQRNGLALKATTYKILVRAFWREGRVNDAIMAVKDMEQRGVIGEASVYYELACCLCNNGMWKDALVEIQKLKRLPLTKPLEVAFTGMIQSSMDGGHLLDCATIFEHIKDYCDPNIGTINAMLKVYSRRDMFAKAKELFEAAKTIYLLTPDAYSYILMLEASAISHQWEYFEHIYKEMTLCGYQLDQQRHTKLLVQASRSGKSHLLEHTFDNILGAGEIPCMSLFTELLCVAVAQQNYERAVPLVNGMAYASMQVSERQWINLFEKNKDRIDGDKMRGLLDVLVGGSVVKEDPVHSLIKSLQLLCKPRKSPDGNFPPSDVAEGMLDSYGRKIARRINGVPHDNFALTVANNTTENKGGPLENHRGMPGLSKNYVEEYSHEEPTATDVFRSGNRSDDHASCHPSTGNGCESDSNYSMLSTDTERTIESLSNQADTSYQAEPPSALEILKIWKNKRIEDGIFLFRI